MSDSSKSSVRASVPLGSLNAVLLLAAAVGLFTSNPLESVFAILQLKFILQKLWKQNIPPVAVLLFLFPWLEISTSVLEANIRGISLDEMLHGTGRAAYWLSAFGLLCVQVGFLFVHQHTCLPDGDRIRTVAQRYSLNRLIGLYFFIGPFTSFVARFIGRGALYQLITYLNEIAVVLLIAICLRQVALKQINAVFIGFLTIVTILSFYSLFSSWKIVAFALFISLGTAVSLSRKLVMRIVFLSLVFGNLIFLWQGVKGDYRGYITGSGDAGALISQRVVVGREDALAKFFELSRQFYVEDADSREESAENQLLFSTLRRAGYLEFFSMVLNKVPEEIPYENGKLLNKSLSFALIPRFLNPNKGVKDDGAKVEKYTDFMVSDTASFSLGHYVEYYIDFKALGMMIVLLIYGWVGGRIISFIVSREFMMQSLLFTIPIVYVCLDKWGQFQADTVFLYGQTFWGTLCHTVLFIPIYRVIDRLAKAQ